jgi:phage FluMu protein Com
MVLYCPECKDVTITLSLIDEHEILSKLRMPAHRWTMECPKCHHVQFILEAHDTSGQ